MLPTLTVALVASLIVNIGLSWAVWRLHRNYTTLLPAYRRMYAHMKAQREGL